MQKAKLSRIFGILACLFFPPLGIASIILAVQSKNEMGGTMTNEAKAGFICGIIALAVSTFLLLYVL